MNRWIPAPISDNETASGAVHGVSLAPGESVEWVYTITPDGKRIVTGYDILPALTPEKANELMDKLRNHTHSRKDQGTERSSRRDCR